MLFPGAAAFPGAAQPCTGATGARHTKVERKRDRKEHRCCPWHFLVRSSGRCRKSCRILVSVTAILCLYRWQHGVGLFGNEFEKAQPCSQLLLQRHHTEGWHLRGNAKAEDSIEKNGELKVTTGGTGGGRQE